MTSKNYSQLGAAVLNLISGGQSLWHIYRETANQILLLKGTRFVSKEIEIRLGTKE